MVNSRMIIDDRLLNKLEYLKKRQLNSFFFDNELDVTYSHLYDSFPEFLRPYFHQYIVLLFLVLKIYKME